MPPKRTGRTAAGRGRSAVGRQWHPYQAVKELEAGLHLLQQPFSDAAMLAVVHHLEAAVPHYLSPITSMHSIVRQTPDAGGHFLELLNAYLEWLLPGVTQPSQPASYSIAPTSSGSSSSRRRHILVIDDSSSSSSRSSSATTGLDTLSVKGRMNAVGYFLDMLFHFLASFSDDVKAGLVQAPAVHPRLLAEGTGTFSLLSKAIDLVLRYPAESVKEQISRYTNLLGIWCMSGSRAIGNPSAGFNLWRDAPAMAQALPAVAQLMHTYLQHPPQARPNADFDDYYIGALTQQLLLLMEATAAAGGQQPCCATSGSRSCVTSTNNTSSSSSATAAANATTGHGRSSSSGTTTATTEGRGSMRHRQRAATTAQDALHVSDTPNHEIPGDMLLSQTARAQVECFLWHVLATASASLQSDVSPPACPCAGSDSSSSTASSRGGIHSPLPSGAGYGLQLKTGAMVVGGQASLALLQLATTDLPQQQLAELAAAVDWMQQGHAACADGASAPMRGGSSGRPCLADLFHRHTASGYLCWPQAFAAAPSDPPIENNSSSSGSSNGTATASCATIARMSSADSQSQQGAPPLNTNGSSSNTTPSASTTATSTSEADSLQDTSKRLQLLAAAVGTWCSWLTERFPSPTSQALLTLGIRPQSATFAACHLTHMVLLLVQQLQGAHPQLHAEFLNSPAGSSVLQVLSEVASGIALHLASPNVLARGGPEGLADLQQEMQGAGSWQSHELPGRAVMQQLLLPGLLLRPAPAQQACSCSSCGHNSSSSNSSCAGCQACSSSSSSSEGEHHLQGVPSHTAAAEDALPISGGCVMLNLGNTPSEETADAKLVPRHLVPVGTVVSFAMLPPAAFFLVEQLLRDQPSLPGMLLAVQLLQGSTYMFHQPSEEGGSDGGTLVELQQLAYCSLTSRVVNVAVRVHWLGAWCASDMLQLAMELLTTAEHVAAAQHGGSSSRSGSSSSSSNSSRSGSWSPVASLAAAAAAGAYTAHINYAEWHGPDSCPGICLPPAGGSSEQASTTEGDPGITPVTSNSSSGGAEHGPAAAGTGPPAVTCSVCMCATGLYAALRHLERGGVWPALPWAVAIAVAAQRTGNFLAVELERAMVKLARRRPVPGVCGNIFCKRLNGAAASAVVRGRVGSLCGGCRAAWYCCEECQRKAWPAHKAVCRSSG